jgi:hypothetical protein
MKSPRHRSTESGFTLIEALIAIVVLVFGLIGITNLFVVATASNQIGNLTTAAAVRSSETLEKLKSVPYMALTPGGSLSADVGTAGVNGGVMTATNVLAYHTEETVPGVGIVKSRWVILNNLTGDNDAIFIQVRSEVFGPFGGQLSRAEYSTWRTCTTRGCPNIPA